MATSSKTVVLASGLAVSLTALQILWTYEARGCRLVATDSGFRVIGPQSQLRPADIDRLRLHRDDLRELLVLSETLQ
ncbi:MAG: hypothetical protein H0W53_14735 [Acidobacteria bacterium]|nr:hypothetical protein [Acidobacteriota bacterium]